MLKTTTLETSKKLKLAGFPQDNFAAHEEYPDKTTRMIYGHSLKIEILNVKLAKQTSQDEYNRIYGQETNFFAAPISDEILEVLPEELRGGQLCMTHTSVYYQHFEPYEPARIEHLFNGEFLVEALAKMYLYLKSKGII